ncbi:MAG: hypothetical protein H7A23_01030 [Leptospiraceae bacterium]|nr:hypothetical protein [Leptospiraceae bacterium]
MGDWLGTGNIAPRDIEYRSFEEARKFVHNLGLKSQSEWVKYCKGEMPEKGKKPDDIPRAAYVTYKEQGWKGMGAWLGTGTIAPQNRKFISFEKARKFVQKLRLQSSLEWTNYCKGELTDLGIKPDEIPSDPSRVYKNKGWVDWNDWLGTGRVRRNN